MFEKKSLERGNKSLCMMVWTSDDARYTDWIAVTVRPTLADYIEVAYMPLSYADAEWLAGVLTEFVKRGRGGNDVSKSDEN